MSKKGLRRINEDMDAKSGFFTQRGGDNKLRYRSRQSWGEWAMERFVTAPFHSPARPTMGQTIVTAVLILVGSLLHGLVVVALLAGFASSDTTTYVAIDKFVIGLTAAIAVVLPELWTHDRRLRIHTQFGLPLATWLSGRISLLVALAKIVLIFAGYAFAGLFARALGLSVYVGGAYAITTPVYAAGVWTMTLCQFVVLFVYIYNQDVEQFDESEGDNHWRTVMETGFAVFLLTIVGVGRGLASLEGGVFFAAYIANNLFDGEWGWYIFFVWPIAAVMAGVLYNVVWAILEYLKGGMRVSMSRGYTSIPPDYDEKDEMEAAHSEPMYAMSAPVNARTRKNRSGGLDVEF